MPLIKKPSKQAFEHNIKAEMSAGKPQDQSLAIAYGIKKKNKKKMASGGEVNDSVKTEARPMPSERDNDSKSVGRNSGDKALKDSQWGDDPTVRQAQKPSPTKLSQPKQRGSDAFSGRNSEMHDDEADMTRRIKPETDRAQPVSRDNEYGPNRQGTPVPDMAAQHNNKKAPYNKEIEDQYAIDVANANMKKAQSYAAGGRVEMEPKDHGDELEERDDEMNMQMDLAPGKHGEQPASWRDEVDADGSGNDVPDMEREHSNGRKPYYMGGQTSGSADEDSAVGRYARGGNIADEIMRKRKMMAEGGMLSEDEMDTADNAEDGEDTRMVYAKSSGGSGSSDMDKMRMMADGGQVDLEGNSEEDLNNEDQMSYKAGLKEQYDLSQLGDEPEDSNEKGDDREDFAENIHDDDMISEIRRRMKARRG